MIENEFNNTKPTDKKKKKNACRLDRKLILCIRDHVNLTATNNTDKTAAAMGKFLPLITH